MNNPLQYGGSWDDNYFTNYYSRFISAVGILTYLTLNFTETSAALVVRQILTVNGVSANVTLGS